MFYARNGKRTDDACSLRTRGGMGVINMKTSSKIGKFIRSLVNTGVRDEV